eukprot:4703730-Karenia_brevis.AAC.1
MPAADRVAQPSVQQPPRACAFTLHARCSSVCRWPCRGAWRQAQASCHNVARSPTSQRAGLSKVKAVAVPALLALPGSGVRRKWS